MFSWKLDFHKTAALPVIVLTPMVLRVLLKPKEYLKAIVKKTPL